MRRWLLLALALVLVGAAGCDDGSNKPGADAAELGDTSPDVTATTVTGLFDLDAAIHGDSQTFYDFPFPSGLRVDAQGHPLMDSFPATNTELVRGAVALVQTERPGFSPVGAAYFRFDGLLDERTLPTPAETLDPAAGAQIVDIDPTSPGYGTRLPAYVSFRADRSAFWRSNTLVVRTMPGLNMRPGTEYAVVLTRALRSGDGGAVVPAPAFQAVLDGTAPEPLAGHYAELLSRIADADVDTTQLVSATRYRTSDAATELDALRGAVLAAPSSVIADWALAERKSAYETYTGTFVTTEFFSDAPPYSSPLGKGKFVFEADGTPLNGLAQTVRFAVTVPTAAAPPSGYPVVVYGHGTGGDYLTQTRTNSEGPWLSSVGIATLGFDAALHGTRRGATSDVESIIATNPIAAREVVRQTVVDFVVVYRVLREGGFVIPDSVTGRGDLTLNASPGLFMGHSQGSQEAGLLLGIEAGIEAAFLSAGGGGTVIALLEREFNGAPIACAVALVMGIDCDELTADHPASTLIVQPLMDPADPLLYAHRFIREPPPGLHAKHIAMSEGTLDTYTPPLAQEALATAIGLHLVEPVARTSDPIDLAALPRDTAPVQANVTASGGAVTGGLIQFQGEGHFAIYDRADARNRYVEFFRTALSGTPVIVGAQ